MNFKIAVNEVLNFDVYISDNRESSRYFWKHYIPLKLRWLKFTKNKSNVLFPGKVQPRVSNSPKPLPNPLDVTSTLQSIPVQSHESVTALLGAWSELLLHDLAMTGNLKSQDCCVDNAGHPECYGKLGNGQCKEYMRTLPSMDMDQCSFSKYFWS